ncbi:hypothetical protein G7Y89_g5867 [Cudoniella acicularis]|uniref:Uncharacterized protein n=1 Tax=Cudoniella acicularis TaxID=354080 RepID=A0A8H4RNU2_9HELO|nr:hypothetical protein G7Y89_g5867 [Cudoniella acicularis]
MIGRHKIEHHTARHLKDLALWSLPQTDTSMEDEEGSEKRAIRDLEIAEGSSDTTGIREANANPNPALYYPLSYITHL